MKDDKELLKELYEASFGVYQLVHFYPDDGRIKRLKQILDETKEEFARKERRRERLNNPPPTKKLDLWEN